MKKHGFEIDNRYTIVPDYVLMAKPKEEVRKLMKNLTYELYLKFKLDMLKTVVQERAQECKWEGDDTARLNYTRRAIQAVENQLKELQ